MAKHVTGIDIGTHHVKVVIAEAAEDPRLPPRILGTGYAEARGMRQGYVISVPEAARSIAAAVAQASKAARVKVKRVYLGIGGIGLEEAFARGETVVERGDSVITARDLPRAQKAAEEALAPAARQNRITIHHIPLRYSVDSVRVLGKTPIGMKGSRIGVEMLFITCMERHIADMKAAVEEAGFEVDDVCASPLAASFVALTKMQKRVGCVLTNIGAETVSLIVFEDSVPTSIKVLPFGGNDITNDLALGLRISPEDAEQLKQGAVLGAPYPKRKIDDIIQKRMSDLFKHVEAHLKKIGKNELLPGGILLTGGGATVQGADTTAKAVLRLPARVATLGEGSTKMPIQGGAWSVAYGLTVWGFSEGGELEMHEHTGVRDVLYHVWRWFKKFLP